MVKSGVRVSLLTDGRRLFKVTHAEGDRRCDIHGMGSHDSHRPYEYTYQHSRKFRPFNSKQEMTEEVAFSTEKVYWRGPETHELQVQPS